MKGLCREYFSFPVVLSLAFTGSLLSILSDITSPVTKLRPTAFLKNNLNSGDGATKIYFRFSSCGIRLDNISQFMAD